MSTFFVDPDAITPPTIRLVGDLLHHLRDSLRLHPGDYLTLNDGCGARYRVEVTHVTSQAIESRIIDQQNDQTRKTSPIVLGQALIKGDKMDWVIQKATELGVDTIVPVHSTHSVVKPRPERLDHQRSRWERIARDAAQQSERWTIPTVADPTDLPQICRQYASVSVKGMLEGRPAALPLPPCHCHKTIRIRSFCWLGQKGDGQQTSSDLQQSRASTRSLSGHESCEPRPQRLQRSAFFNQDLMR